MANLFSRFIFGSVPSNDDPTFVTGLIENSTSIELPSYSRPLFLDLPASDLLYERSHDGKRERKVHTYDTGNVSYAETRNSGKSHLNEDNAMISECSINIPGRAFFVKIFGIFDGHAGADISNYCARNFERVFKKITSDVNLDIAYESVPLSCVLDIISKCIKDTFIAIDKEVETFTFDYPQGSCALIVFLIDDYVFVANAGDSRALLVRKDSLEQITQDHTCTNSIERRRIQRVAAIDSSLLMKRYERRYIENPKEIEIGKPIDYYDFDSDEKRTAILATTPDEKYKLESQLILGYGPHAKIMAKMATTRAIGDHSLQSRDGVPIRPFLSPIPDVFYFKRPEDSIILIGSDGFFEEITNEAIFEMMKNGNNLEELINDAKGRSGDDITVMAIEL